MTGSRGPISMPDNVRALKGNPGQRKTKESVKARPGTPSAPAGMETAALAEWRRMIPLLQGEGLLSRLDRGVLVTYCEAYALAAQAKVILDDEGLVVECEDGTKKNPAWMIWREARATMLAAAKELLATPISRLRTMKPEAADVQDPAEGILD